MTLTAHSHQATVDATDSGAAALLEDVTRSFGATPVLRGLDLRIGAGEIVSLIGRSGSGKSTALRLLAGLDDDAGGRILLSCVQKEVLGWEDPTLEYCQTDSSCRSDLQTV